MINYYSYNDNIVICVYTRIQSSIINQEYMVLLFLTVQQTTIYSFMHINGIFSISMHKVPDSIIESVSKFLKRADI